MSLQAILTTLFPYLKPSAVLMSQGSINLDNIVTLDVVISVVGRTNTYLSLQRIMTTISPI